MNTGDDTATKTSPLIDFMVARLTEDRAVAIGDDAPDRTVAECEAKGHVVGLLIGAEAMVKTLARPLDLLRAEAMAAAYLAAVKYLAVPYADHPDYRDEWKP